MILISSFIPIHYCVTSNRTLNFIERIFKKEVAKLYFLKYFLLRQFLATHQITLALKNTHRTCKSVGK